MFGLSITGFMYTSYGTFFYNDKLGSPLRDRRCKHSLFALDAFNDPITGVLSDRTRNQMGQAQAMACGVRPNLFDRSILFFSRPLLGKGMCPCRVLHFFPHAHGDGKHHRHVNYHSLLPELFRQTDQRNAAKRHPTGLQLAGMIIGVSLVPMIASALWVLAYGGDLKSFGRGAHFVRHCGMQGTRRL